MRHRAPPPPHSAHKSALRGNSIGRTGDVKLVCRGFTFSLLFNTRSKLALA